MHIPVQANFISTFLNVLSKTSNKKLLSRQKHQAKHELTIKKSKKIIWQNMRGRLRDFRSKLFRQEIWPTMHFHDIISVSSKQDAQK